MMSFIEEFIATNYLIPLCKYYTPIGTLTYGIILVGAVAVVYKLLEKLKIEINKNFFLALLPFIIYGGWTRALRDHSLGVYTTNAWWWCSPPIYFLIFVIALSSLLIGIALQKRFAFPYHKFMIIIGAVLLAYNFSITTITNFNGFGIILGLFTFWVLVFLAARKFLPKFFTAENTGILSSHMLDASSTFTAITFFGYYEQHVLPSFLIGIFGPWIMFPLKIIVVGAVLWVIDKDKGDKRFKGFLKIVILILGLALGIRDWLTVSMLAVG